nr:hypothetical protein [Pseudomonas alcaliphila]
MKPIKQQWLLLSHQQSVASALERHIYSTDINPGFELLEIKHEFVRGRYIERQESLESIKDPFGAIESLPITKYIFFDFSVTPIKPGLSLIKISAPPASIKNFTTLLSTAFKFSASLKKLSFNLQKVYDEVSSNTKVARLSVSKVIASNVPIENEALAKIEVTSSKDALQDLYKAFDTSKARLERLTMSLRLNLETEHLELSSSGAIYCSKGAEELLMPLISE